MRPLWQHSRTQALTLIEVLIAVLIFGLVAIGAMTFFMYGRSHINAAGNRRLAVELARARLEQLKAGSYSSVVSGSESGLALGDIQATRTTTVVERNTASGRYKEVSVCVRWPQHDPQNEIWLYTIIAAP